MFEHLNVLQRRAVTSPTSVIVQAPPGSGKTEAFACRVAFLVFSGVSPFNLLCLTYTNSAVRNMRQRLAELGVPAGVAVETLHSFASALLDGDGRSLLSEYERFLVARKVWPEEPYFLVKPVLEFLDASFPERQPEGVVARVLERYPDFRAEVARRSRFTYGQLIREATERAPLVPVPYEEVLVDEYQDVTRPQMEFLRAVPKKRLFAVGDDDQSIFGFGGARPGLVSEFFRTSVPGFVSVSLKENYRSCEMILLASDLVMGRAPPGALAPPEGAGVVRIRCYPTAAEEAAHTVSQIAKALETYRPDQVAVMAYRHAQLKDVCLLLEKRGVPFTPSREVNVLEHPLVLKLVAVLRCAAGGGADGKLRHQLSCFDFLRGVAPEALDELVGCGDRPLFVVRRLYELSLHDYLRQRPPLLRSVFGAWLDQLRAHVEHGGTGAEFCSMLDTMHHKKMPLYAPRGPEEPAGAVQILTAHKAKSLGFEVVFFVGNTDRAWSVHRLSALDKARGSREEHHEEHRRLFNVVVTRAKKVLVVSYDESSGPSPFVRILAPTFGTERPDVGLEDVVALKTLTRDELFLDHATPCAGAAEVVLSPTAMTAYERCGVAFFLERLRPWGPDGASEALRFGVAVHSALERFLRGAAATASEALEGFPHPELLGRAEAALLRWEQGRGAFLRRQQAVCVEEAFFRELEGGCHVTGKVDFCYRPAAGGAPVVVDFKTGEVHKRNLASPHGSCWVQGAFYCVLLSECLSTEVTEVQFDFVEKDCVQTLTYRPAQLAAFRKRMVQTWAEIRGPHRVKGCGSCVWCLCHQDSARQEAC